MRLKTMKKIIFSMMMLGCLVGLAACSSDDTENPYAVERAIKVVQSDVLFPVTASTGSVTVEAAHGITKVVNNADWISYTVDGNTVNVSVEQNNRFTGRTSRLSIYSGEDSTYVVVQQQGIDFILSAGSEILSDDEAREYAFYMHSNMPVEIVSTDDWFTATIDGDSLRFSLTANETAKFRHGSCVYQVGEIQGEIKVTQRDFEKDVLGNYKLIYTSSSNWVYTPVTLERNGDGFQLRFTGSSYASRGIILPVKLNENALTMTIQNLQSIEGTYTKSDVNYYLYARTLYTNGSSVYSNKTETPYILGKFNENEDGTFTWDYSIQEVSSSYTYYALRICYGTKPSGPDAYNAHVGNYVTFIDMYLEKE